MKVLVLNPFTLDADAHSDSYGLACADPTLTVQADAEQADINYIVKQFGLTHELPYGLAVPEYADYTDIPNDFHAAQNFIADANDAFMQYPASIRSRFNNDAGQFLDFVRDDSNRAEASSLGIISRLDNPLSTDGLPVSKDGDSSPSATSA